MTGRIVQPTSAYASLHASTPSAQACHAQVQACSLQDILHAAGRTVAAAPASDAHSSMHALPDRSRHAQQAAHLQDLLHATGDVVVLLADDAHVEHAGGGVQRVHRRVDAQLGDAARQHRRRVQMRKGGGGRRVRQVIGRHVDGLRRRSMQNQQCPLNGIQWQML